MSGTVTQGSEGAGGVVQAQPGAASESVQRITFDLGIDLTLLQQMLQQARERRATRELDERVSTVNLVAVYFSQQGYERARAALEAAGTLHPARLLVLIAQAKQPGDLVHGEVSVLRAGSSVALERVVLSAAGSATRHLQSAMLGLLVPELPVVFIWGGRPEGSLFEKVLENADRIIIDSGTRPLASLQATARRVAAGAPIGDLAWARIFPWQATAAEMLDQPNLREHRGRIARARVTAAGQPGAEAALLAGWFASRVRKAKVELIAGPLPSPEQAAPLDLPPDLRADAVHAPPLSPGQVTSLVFEAPPATFTIHRERGILVAEVRGDDDGEVVHRVRLPAETPGRLLGLELKLLAGVDDLYAAALQVASRLVEPIVAGAAP
jgi:glucose-6-phosphate dehydrogenase assembly protein OpcA